MIIQISVEVNDRLPFLARRLRARLRPAVKEAIGVIERGAIGRAPVRTGALRASIRSRMIGELSGIVQAGVRYAAYVEFGTRRSRAQPFLRPAAEGAQAELIRAIIHALE